MPLPAGPAGFRRQRGPGSDQDCRARDPRCGAPLRRSSCGLMPGTRREPTVTGAASLAREAQHREVLVAALQDGLELAAIAAVDVAPEDMPGLGSTAERDARVRRPGRTGRIVLRRPSFRVHRSGSCGPSRMIGLLLTRMSTRTTTVAMIWDVCSQSLHMVPGPAICRRSDPCFCLVQVTVTGVRLHAGRLGEGVAADGGGLQPRHASGLRVIGGQAGYGYGSGGVS